MGAWFAGLLNGITKASVNRRRGRSNREFQSQVCIRCRQVGPLAGGDICDVQAVVNVQLGDKAGMKRRADAIISQWMIRASFVLCICVLEAMVAQKREAVLLLEDRHLAV